MLKPYTHKNVIVCIDNIQLTGNNCLVESIEFTRSINSPTKIRLDLVCNDNEILMELFNEKQKRKIRNKRVNDCTIEELLFAVREKLKVDK